MCRRVVCKACGKADWRGCGAHVEQVLGDVPRAERCRCRQDGPPATTSPGTGAGASAGPTARRRWWRR